MYTIYVHVHLYYIELYVRIIYLCNIYYGLDTIILKSNGLFNIQNTNMINIPDSFK